jgi:hypothetical protein
VMILGAVYLLWMFQRVVLGEPSAFLLGLKHHLIDMTATELLTLAPLGALVVVFGLSPGVLLNLVSRSAKDALAAVAPGSAIAIDPLFIAAGLGVVAAVVAARLLALRPRRPTDDGGSAVQVVEHTA